MDFDLPGDRSRTTVPPGVALAVATIVAASVTGLAVAGLTWTLDRSAGQPTGLPPEVAFERAPGPSTTVPIDTPGWAEALGLPAPTPVAPGAAPGAPGTAPADGAGAVATPPAPSGPVETVRRTAAARRPTVGPTASVRSTPTAVQVAPATAGPGAIDDVTPVPSVPGPGAVSTGPAAAPSTAFDAGPATGPAGPATGPATGPAATGFDADAEPTANETTAPRRRWEPPRRTWRDEPRPAPAPQWGGPFGNFPRMFPWG